MERERKRKRAKEREKNEGRLGKRTFSSPVSPRFFPSLSLALFFARAPLSERLEQAIVTVATIPAIKMAHLLLAGLPR